jgi:hypothetical protein
MGLECRNGYRQTLHARGARNSRCSHAPERSGQQHIQSTGQVGSSDFSDELRVAAHDELVPSPRQPDVEPFAGALEGGLLVDDEYDGATFEAFEENVAVDIAGGLRGRTDEIDRPARGLTAAGRHHVCRPVEQIHFSSLTQEPVDALLVLVASASAPTADPQKFGDENTDQPSFFGQMTDTSTCDSRRGRSG